MSHGPKVVIIGAGIVGCALVDELAMRGWTDVTVLEQGPLFATGGSTSHAPGMIFQTNSSKTITSFAQYTVQKYLGLSPAGGWGFNPVGSLEIALTPERVRELHRRQGWAEAWGLEGRVVDPDEACRLWPLLDRERIHGGYHVPSDGITKAVGVSEVMARRAMEAGAVVLGGHTVTDITTGAGGRVTGVVTDRGEFAADIVVCAAGIWGPKVGAMVGVRVPLQPLAHQLVRTAPLPALAGIAAPPDLEMARPILRIQDRDLYAREFGDRLAVGTYGHRPLPLSAWDLLPHDEAPVMPSVLEFTPDDFEESWGWAKEVIPALRDTEIQEPFNGAFSFTPDGNPLLGEARDVPGFWLAEAVWVTHSAGVGKAVAEWLVDGAPSVDVHECDIARFEPYQLAPTFISERGIQNYIEVYDIVHPLQPMGSPRPLRTSPFYEAEQELGAVFLEGGGWERPHWYETNATLLRRYEDRIPARGEWASRYWSPIAGAEALATRDGVALYDLSSLKRIEVTGPGALPFLDRLTTNRLDRPVGSVVYTLMLEDHGGIRSDLTIARLATDRFQIGANGILDLAWLERHAPHDGSVVVRDVSAGTCCLGLWGPKARDVLASLADIDVSNEAFGYFRAREFHVGHVPVTALRLSYVGELGWELYASADMGRKLWDELWAAGKPFGMIAAGRSAFGSLRLEKGYRSWGTDVTTEHDPYAAGLGFAVRMDKGDFIGRAALEGRSEATAANRLVALVLDDPTAVMMGKEPVAVDGRPAGYVTSAGFGFSVGASIAYAWLPATAATPGTRVTIASFGESLPATVVAEPLFDAAMDRLRG